MNTKNKKVVASNESVDNKNVDESKLINDQLSEQVSIDSNLDKGQRHQLGTKTLIECDEVISRAMRKLSIHPSFQHEDGKPNYSRIGDSLDRRPQHARNVLTTPLSSKK